MQTVLERSQVPPSVLRSGGSYWPATLSSAFVELEFQQLETSHRPIRGRIYQYPFGDLTLQRSITTGNAHRVTRSERLIRTSPHDNFFIGLLLAGGAVFAQGGRTAALRPGDIAILDCTRVYTIDVPKSFDALWIRAPRHRFEERVRGASEVLATRIDGRSGIGHVAAEMYRAALLEAPNLSVKEANNVASTLLDLLGIAVPRRERRRENVPSTHCAALLRRVQDLVESRLDEETLTPAAVARANRVSVRYVNRLFEREGFTLARWIRTRRLERCRKDLEVSWPTPQRIADIAYSHGFKNISHFNRLFRARFGCSPRQFQQRA